MELLPDDYELKRRGRYKRAYDLFVMLGAHLFPPLAVLWVMLWLVIPVLIWVEDRGPVFYRQTRVGKNGKIFSVFKFRTMIPDAESSTGPVWSATDDQRITRVGGWLRAAALDELPQILNIIKGDMSFVGPRAERPELHQQFALSNPMFALRTQVRPGLTGLAQIEGSYDLPPKEKLHYDLTYINGMGPLLDTRLMLRSVGNTLLRRWDRKERG